MLGCLIKIQPYDLIGAARVDVRCSTFGKREHAAANGTDGVLWEPSIVQAPSLAITLWNGNFADDIRPSAAVVPINLEILRRTWPVAAQYMWMGAPIEIYAGEPGSIDTSSPIFRGRVRSYGGSGPRQTLQCEVDLEPFAANILTASYAGTGGIEGDANIKNKLKPLALGRPRNVEPVLIDAANSVYQFSGYGPIEAVDALYERGSDFGPVLGYQPTYADLVALEIPEGRWAACLPYGLVRLGAPAAGVITGDIRGHVVGSSSPRLTGAVIDALRELAGVDDALVESASFAALDSDKPYPISVMITEQGGFLEWAQRLVRPCNWVCGVSTIGKLFAADVSLSGSEEITLDAQGGAAPQVIGAEELDVPVPYARTIMGAEKCWRVHTDDEIAWNAELIDRGLYSALETYREGNMVSLDDGSRWLYVNAEPSSGNAPPAWPTTSNSHWENMTPPLALAMQLIGYLTNPAHTVAADAEGNVVSFEGAGGEFIVSHAGIVLEDGVTYSVVSETGVDVSIDSEGVYTVSSMSAAQGTARFRAVYDDMSVELVYSIAKSTAGDDGSDAVSVVLTNETHTVPTDAEGNNGDFSGANGKVQVFNHTGDITGAATIGAGTFTGCTGTVNTAINSPVAGQPKGYYRVTAMSADQASVDIPVTIGLVTVTKRMTLSRNKTGAAIGLVADRQHIAYDGAGAASPSTQTTNFSVTIANVAGGVTEWQVASLTGSFGSATGLMTTGSTTGSMTRAQFETIAGSTRGVRVKVRKAVGASYIEDVVTITKVQEGADGVDGVDSTSVRIVQDRYGITYDSAGSLAPSSQTTTFYAEKTNTTATITWSVHDFNGAARTPVTSYLSAATGDSVTMTAAQFDAARNGTKGVTVTATPADGTPVDKASQVQVPQGANALGFVQDSPTPTAQFVNQSWYRPGLKRGYYWSGSAWVPMLGDLSTLNTVDTDIIDPNAISQAVSVTSAVVATIGGALYPNLYCPEYLNITTEGGEVHVIAEILTQMLYSPTLSTGGSFDGMFAMTRGPASVPITRVPYVGATTLASYLTNGGCVAVIPSFAGRQHVHGGAAQANVFTPYEITTLSHKDAPAAGSWTYAIWLGPGSANHSITTRNRQFIENFEVKR